MPAGKYYCDYCDKQFQDTPAARRRHLHGLQHQRAKALWYNNNNNSLRDSNNQILPESLGKGVCNRFVRTGSCLYGDSCKYIHSRQSLESLNSQGVPGRVVRDNMGISLGNLPPSLQPPPDGGYPPLPFIDWG